MKQASIVIFSFFLHLFIFAQQDTLHAVDKIVSDEACYVKFFRDHERVPSLGETMLVTKAGKTVSMLNFLKTNEFGLQAEHGLADLDGDGKKELILFNFTGGAHCCDEFYFFKSIGKNKYQYTNKFFGGNACIDEKNDMFFNFYESFGYFFTCYACSYTDTTETAPETIWGITMRYKKGKLAVVPGDTELKNTINDNLAKLSEQPYHKLADAADQDNGLRKEFALNLVVHYYSFGRNLAATKLLFNKYYKFPDAAKVWTEFVKTLNGIKKSNDF